MTLNIKAVSERTGVPLHTLRAWERRYGIPRPARHAENRYRLYDEQDIADVLWMKRQIQAGVAPAQASALLLQQPRAPLGAAVTSGAPTDTLRDSLYEAFVRRDDTAAQNVWNEAWSALAPEVVLLEIVQPALWRIGENWQRNLLSVEQEHFASNLVRQRLHALIQAQPAAPLAAPHLVAACAPEEQHDLGLLMFTLLARRQGWDVKYLGQRTPLQDLLQASRAAQFGVVSVTTVAGLASLLPLWNDELFAVSLLYGGGIFNAVPVLREHVPGVFLAGDAAQSLQTLATSTPRARGWRPPRGRFHAAQALEAARLPIVSETVSQFRAPASKQKTRVRPRARHDITQPALFLTDALISALAFDAPQILDVQGAWANEFMPAHQIPLDALHAFLQVYEAQCARWLRADSRKLVRELLERFRAALASSPAEVQ